MNGSIVFVMLGLFALGVWTGWGFAVTRPKRPHAASVVGVFHRAMLGPPRCDQWLEGRRCVLDVGHKRRHDFRTTRTIPARWEE